jgi:hypothetical protein
MAIFLFEMSVMYAHCKKHLFHHLLHFPCDVFLCHHLDFPCDVFLYHHLDFLCDVFLFHHLYLIFSGHVSFCNGRDLPLPSFVQQWE